MIRHAVDWLFRSRQTGQIVIGQWPNLPLWLFLAATLAAFPIDPQGPTGKALRLAATLSLAWWAADEVLRGANPWRRMLGAGVLAWLTVRLAGLA